MRPDIPLAVLYPAVVIVLSACALLVAVIAGRRFLHFLRGRRDVRLLGRARRALLEGDVGEALALVAEGTDGMKALVAAVDETPAVARRRIEALAVPAVEDALRRALAPERVEGRNLAARWRRFRLRATEPFRRAQASRLVGRLGFLGALPDLAAALEDEHPSVVYAAAAALARLDTPEAARALLARIGRPDPGRVNDTPIVARIERMRAPMDDILREALEDPSPRRVFWTLHLVGTMRRYELVTEVRKCPSHEDPNVRAAALECIARLGVEVTDRWCEPLLDDPVWYVQAHAAKAVGRFRSRWAVPRLVELLSHENWWVRQDAAEALVAIGSEAAEEVEKALTSSDRFQRERAAEVLDRIGWLDPTLARAAAGDPRARDALEAFAPGGRRGLSRNGTSSGRHAERERHRTGVPS